ncbi:MAG: flagellin lysine-N-methylase [Lachnospiraceae bacterium]|nr:flagellin lysine-N-methylase [Lachnospiraceae bacterium]
MELVMPDYYEDFVCVAGECEDTCCAGWQIYIDAKSMKKYKKVKGEFGKRLKGSIDKKSMTFKQVGRRCAFLNENNLCDIYSAIGKDMLCDTCKTFPRHIEEYEGMQEMSLSLSCPAVARYLMNRTEKVDFIRRNVDIEEEEYEEFDYLLFSKLLDIKEKVLDILRNRDYPINMRIMMTLGLAHDAQTRIDGNRIFEIDAILERYNNYEGFKKRLKALTPNRDTFKFVNILDEFEVLNPSWREFLDELPKMNKGDKKYSEIQLEQLLVYFVSIYLCGAVYDYDLYGKMKFAAISVIILNELSAYVEDVAKLAYRYSKELEHSDINIERMEKAVNDKQITLEMCYLP